MGRAVLPFSHRRAFRLRRRRAAAGQHAGSRAIGQVLHVWAASHAPAERGGVGVRAYQGAAGVDRVRGPGRLHGDGTRDLRGIRHGNGPGHLLHRQARLRPDRRFAGRSAAGNHRRSHRRVAQLQSGSHDGLLRDAGVAARATDRGAGTLARLSLGRSRGRSRHRIQVLGGLHPRRRRAGASRQPAPPADMD